MVDCDSQDTQTEEENMKKKHNKYTEQVNQRIREYVSTVNLTVHMKCILEHSEVNMEPSIHICNTLGMA